MYKEKEELYIKVRSSEGRIVNDEVLHTLPQMPESDRYASEWELRSNSLERFIRYLKKKYGNSSLNILDVGCGNGWMTRCLSEAGHTVTGVDLNIDELEQAESVFHSNNHLVWVYADVMKDEIPGTPFDIILLSASCQYFSSIGGLTARLKRMLSSKGEIHLLDSIFYKNAQVYDAKARSVDYYSRLGFPDMARYYFHHTIEELKSYGYKKLYPRPFMVKQPLQWWVYRNS